jgi:hypothetical protein
VGDKSSHLCVTFVEVAGRRSGRFEAQVSTTTAALMRPPTANSPAQQYLLFIGHFIPYFPRLFAKYWAPRPQADD